jgi:hypothetical protein
LGIRRSLVTSTRPASAASPNTSGSSIPSGITPKAKR